MTKEAVILLHGLARTSVSMHAVGKSLKRAGYHVVNHSYASRSNSVGKLAEREIPLALEKCSADFKKIHFVTHSMGGILLRHFLHDQPIRKLTRTVMLGPPNQGSEIVDKLGNLRLFKFFNGPAGLQLGTSANQNADSLPESLGAWPDHAGELGVIAGRYSVNLYLSTLIPGPDDGKVSVENSKLKGMKDHLVMPATHTFMMRNPQVIRQVETFLSKGEFDR